MKSIPLLLAALTFCGVGGTVHACLGCAQMGEEWSTPRLQPLFGGNLRSFDDDVLTGHWNKVLGDEWQGRNWPDGARILRIEAARGEVFVRGTMSSSMWKEFGAEERRNLADSIRPLIRSSPSLWRVTVTVFPEGGTVSRPVVQLYPGEELLATRNTVTSVQVENKQSVSKGSSADGLSQARTRSGWKRPDRPAAHAVGSLSGASIFLSPGHGWWHNGTGWVTQRGLTNGIIEDHSNAETVIQYLIPFLENAGARVYTARERDMQTNMVIIDDHEGGAFIPNIPETGYYSVYVWYSRIKADTEFTVRHTGGATDWHQRLDQDFDTWKYTGTYWFDEGTSAENGSVTAAHPEAVMKVRFGGGLGDFAVEGRTSGRPRWEESGYYYSRFAGFDPEVTGANRRWNQVHAMPRWAEWEMETWEAGRSIYLSWHTNGSYDHKISGISSYIYSVWAWGPPEFFHGYPGGRKLAEYTHFEVLNDVRTGWDPGWDDVGIVGRWLGETNPVSNSVMPSVLLENGFHDNPHDAAYILEPKFRRLSARAAYQGIVKYFYNEVDGFDSMIMAPDAPTHLQVRAGNDGSATVSWKAPLHDTGEGLLGDAATHFRVYQSRNGKGFDNGTPVESAAFQLRDLEPGIARFVRVAAVNDGGESLPSETLCVSLPASPDSSRVLIVNGFDRLDRGLNFIGPDGAERGVLSRMNSRDYCIQHAAALSSGGYTYDSAGNEAVHDGHVSLGDYDAVVWMLGRESVEDETFNGKERDALRRYVEAGGTLIVSGAHVASDLHRTAEGRAFLGEVLGAVYVPGSSTEDNHLGLPLAESPHIILPGPVPGKAIALSDSRSGPYEVRGADAVAPWSSQTTGFLLWLTPGTELDSDDVARYAAVASTKDRKVLFCSFPIECIVDESIRNALVREFLDDVLK